MYLQTPESQSAAKPAIAKVIERLRADGWTTEQITAYLAAQREKANGRRRR